MKVKVVQAFRDKHTGIIHGKDTNIEMARGRFNEIALSGRFVEEIKETEPKKKVR